jgi:hypothetical protein
MPGSVIVSGSRTPLETSPVRSRACRPPTSTAWPSRTHSARPASWATRWTTSSWARSSRRGKSQPSNAIAKALKREMLTRRHRPLQDQQGVRISGDPVHARSGPRPGQRQRRRWGDLHGAPSGDVRSPACPAPCARAQAQRWRGWRGWAVRWRRTRRRTAHPGPGLVGMTPGTHPPSETSEGN